MGERIQIKADTNENWQKAKNFTPKKGELIFYTDLEQTKIGDGKTNINDLEFIGQKLIGEYDENNLQLTLNWK